MIVSVEGLAVPARAAVLKRLHNVGAAVIGDHDERATHPLALLLHRMVALGRVPDSADAGVWRGSWLLHAPEDPLLRRLHFELGRALADRLLPDGRPRRHLMLWLDGDAHEAFEGLVTDDETPRRDVSLQWMCRADEAMRQELRSNWSSGTLSPFEVQIVHVPCPPFAADNPVAMATLLDRVEAEYRRALHQWTSA